MLRSIAIDVGAFGLLMATGARLLPSAVGVRRPVFGRVVQRVRQLAAAQALRSPVTSLYPPLPDDPHERDKAIRADPARQRLAGRAGGADAGVILLAGWPGAVMDC